MRLDRGNKGGRMRRNTYKRDHRSFVRKPAQQALHNEGKDATSDAEIGKVARRSGLSLTMTGRSELATDSHSSAIQNARSDPSSLAKPFKQQDRRRKIED
jgi:hypothetical protein